jgi:hypothetical protein
VWEGDVGPQRRIVMREAVNGTWLPEVIVDDQVLGPNSQPSIDVDFSGNPHIAWIAYTGGRFTPQYAARIAGKWTTNRLPASDTPGDCDYVSVKIDDNGSPWLVWQSARGTAYEISCAFIDNTGSFHVEPLTPGSQTHNLFPEVVFDPEPNVLWYAGREDGFYLVGERYERTTGQWQEARLANLENLPTEPLPQLIRRPGGLLAGFWNEKPLDADSGALFDRVYLGLQSPDSKGLGEELPQPDAGANSQVSGAATADQFIAAWCSSSSEEGTQIYAAYGKSAVDAAAVKLSDGEDLYYSNPRVAVAGHNADVVWESSESEGGDGQIYFRQLSNLW